MDDDSTLLRLYAETQDTTAFAALVNRHVDFVHSVAQRRTQGDSHLARDVSQQVFLALARCAAALARHPSLLGWLHTCACQRAADLVRAEARRRAREITAATDPALAAEPSLPWETLAPELDLALQTLPARDRETILLRYFSRKPFSEIAARLHTTEAAAQMRAARALEKLRRALAKRGVTSTASALGLALTGHAVTAAPASVAASTLAALASSTAVAATATTATATTTALLTTMATSTKLTLGISALALFSLGLGTGIVATQSSSLAPAPIQATSPDQEKPSPAQANTGIDPATLAARDTEITELKKKLAEQGALLAQQETALAKYTAAEKENNKRRVFRNLDELGKYTAEVSLRMLDMLERYQKLAAQIHNKQLSPDSPEVQALQKEFAQITQDSAVLLEDPLFLDEMKSGDPARMTALQLSYIGAMLQFDPAQQTTFTQAVSDGYRAAYEQKVEWTLTDSRLQDINRTAARTIKASLNAGQLALWERARLNKLLFNFAIGAP
jgi:RNA polymerase sigma factor (sigma-70 family)